MPDAPQPDPQHEQTLARAVLRWIKGLRAEVAISDVEQAIFTGSAVAILAALNKAKRLVLNLMPIATEAGQQAVADLDGSARLGMEFNVHDARFVSAVEQLGGAAITEITLETRKAVQDIVIDGYRQGWNPRLFAPTIAETIGLTTRDSKAVARSLNAMLDGGMKPDLAEARAKRYAAKLARNRGMTVGRTETMAAHNIARHEAWLQAQRNGLFAGRTVYEEWMSVQTDPAEICFQMNGKTTPLGDTFGGLYPPQHPQCKCVTRVVFSPSDF